MATSSFLKLSGSFGRSLTLACLLIVGCASAQANPKPTARGAALLDAQVAGLKGNEAKLIGTFTPDAVVLVPDPRSVATAGLADSIRRTSPHETIKKVNIVKVVSGGDDQVVWVSAELAIATWDDEPGTKAHMENTTVRLTELMTAETGWKVVVGAFSEPHDPTMEKNAGKPLDNATDPGALTELLGSATKLDAALDKDPSVTIFGTDTVEHAYGPAAAHALVKLWSSLALAIEGRPREVRGKSIGYAIARVNWAKHGDPYPSRMAALVIAKPTANNGWSVVAVHYAPL